MDIVTLNDIVPILLRIGAAILSLLIGRWLARRSRVWLRAALAKTKLTASINRLIVTLSYLSILIAAGLVALAFMGVPIQALVASAGVFIVILGIALRESIADVASTITFLLLQPYKVGDVIETCGTLGTVKEIQIFQTVIVTFDGTVVTLSNSKIQSNGITNRSENKIMRGQIDVGISYTDDLAKAKQILEQLMAEDARIVKDPPAIVYVTNFANSGVILSARPFTAYQDNFIVTSDLRERIKARCDEAGITLTFPLLANQS